MGRQYYLKCRSSKQGDPACPAIIRARDVHDTVQTFIPYVQPTATKPLLDSVDAAVSLTLTAIIRMTSYAGGDAHGVRRSMAPVLDPQLNIACSNSWEMGAGRCT